MFSGIVVTDSFLVAVQSDLGNVFFMGLLLVSWFRPGQNYVNMAYVVVEMDYYELQGLGDIYATQVITPSAVISASHVICPSGVIYCRYRL